MHVLEEQQLVEVYMKAGTGEEDTYASSSTHQTCTGLEIIFITQCQHTSSLSAVPCAVIPVL
jgi:hypothetical protein